MNWEAIGAIGEILGAVGVILTVGYLALQVRQNTKIVRSASYLDVATQVKDIFMSVSTNKELADLITQALMGSEVLDRSGTMRVNNYFLSLLGIFESSYQAFQEGIVSVEHWEGIEKSLRQLAHSPYVQNMWDLLPYTFTAGFRNHFQNLIDDARAKKDSV